MTRGRYRVRREVNAFDARHGRIRSARIQAALARIEEEKMNNSVHEAGAEEDFSENQVQMIAELLKAHRSKSEKREAKEGVVPPQPGCPRGCRAILKN